MRKKNKNNDNLNFRKWVLIESKNTFKSKNEKKKNTYFFQSINNRHVALLNADNNLSKTHEMSKNNCFTSNNFERCAKILVVKNAQNFLKKRKTRFDYEKNFEKNFFFQIIVSKYRANLENALIWKRREQRKSCFEKLNKKCFEQKNNVQRFVLKASHHITYFVTI